MLIPQTVPAFAVGTTATSTANRVLAASATVNRYFRGFFATNTTGAPIGLNIGIGAAATLSAANADVAFGFQVPANAASYPVATWNGQGKKALGVGSLNEVMAFASGAGILLNAIYSDDTLV